MNVRDYSQLHMLDRIAAMLAEDKRGNKRAVRRRLYEEASINRDLKLALIRVGVRTAAQTACEAFLDARAGEALPADLSDTKAIVQALRARDGEGCFFCGEAVGMCPSIEHLVPRTEGGTSVLHNLVLSHRDCNHAAGNLPISKKVALRDRMRSLKGGD